MFPTEKKKKKKSSYNNGYEFKSNDWISITEQYIKFYIKNKSDFDHCF